MFEKLKQFYLAANKKSTLSSLEVFLFSALSKTIATMITYPFIFVRTSMVAKKTGEDYSDDVKGKEEKASERKKGMIAIMKYVIAREGPRGIYKV